MLLLLFNDNVENSVVATDDGVVFAVLSVYDISSAILSDRSDYYKSGLLIVRSVHGTVQLPLTRVTGSIKDKQ